MNMHVSTYTKMYKEGYTGFDTRGLYVSYSDVHDYVTDFLLYCEKIILLSS